MRKRVSDRRRSTACAGAARCCSRRSRSARARSRGAFSICSSSNKEFLTEQANDRHLRTVQISAHRGSLTDRYGEPLAVSTPVDTIVANPKELKTALDRLDELADAIGQDEESLARKITSNLGSEFVYLQRHLSPQKSAASAGARAARASAPCASTAATIPRARSSAHLLGFTNVDDRGQEGLEAAFDPWLKGENGSKRVLQDRLGRSIGDVELICVRAPGPRPAH